MKTVLTKFLAISSVGLLMLASCKKEGTLVKSNGGQPGALTANTTTLSLDKTKVNDTAKVITFNFTKTAYGFNAAATNILQIDVPGDNWAHPTSFTLGTGVLSQGFSTADFNSLLLKLNIPAGTTAQVSVRIANSLSTAVKPVYSNVLSLNVTPFNLQSWLYVPGSYEGWKNSTDKAVAPNEDSLYSATDNGVYVGIINFTAGNRDFLILPVKGDWTHKYATNDPLNTTSSTVTYDGPNNYFSPATPGQYIVTFNTNTNTISFAPADFYTIIGSATPGGDWSTDLFLKYINDGTGTWTGTFTLLGGEFKFRQDSQWANSWGIPKAGEAGDGIANTLNDTKNDNIPVTAGSHTVTFTQALTPFGATPSVTATYSLQ